MVAQVDAGFEESGSQLWAVCEALMTLSQQGCCVIVQGVAPRQLELGQIRGGPGVDEWRLVDVVAALYLQLVGGCWMLPEKPAHLQL